VYRAYDIAAGIAQVAMRCLGTGHVACMTAQHNGLTMAANVGQQFNPLRMADQYAACLLLGQGAPVAWLRYESFVLHIKRGVLENECQLLLENGFAEIAAG